jgi:hypothetical protein
MDTGSNTPASVSFGRFQISPHRREFLADGQPVQIGATGVRVVFTRHLSLPKAWMGMMQFRTAMAWQRKDEPDSVAPWFLRESRSTRGRR